uniref:glucan endo-1,3-beta-D-glucosidase n=3 Tax=Cannabis sativa TaxID=3483 RepID=A0A803PWV8_CANSA
MARGLKKHLKRLNAPKHWMLDKLGGAFAPKPSSGPHKSRECLPLILILRNRLKYALTYREVQSILMQRHVMVDGKVRTDKTYPSGFMDVVSIPKTNENFRLLYDTKGRFRLHSVRDDEAKFKLCKVRSVQFGQKGIPYLNTYDGRTIRYPDPLIKANDTIKLDLEANKITDFIKFDVGNVVMVTGGRNRGRVGVIKNREKHKGTFETIHVQDALGHEFATRLGNVFTIGKGTKPWISLPKGKGIKLTILEEAKKRLAAQAAATALGVNWGTMASHPLPPPKVVELLKSNNFTKVKLFDADPLVLEALSGSNIRVTVGIPNTMLKSLNSSKKAAESWVHDNVTRYVSNSGSRVRIEYVAVGDEPFLQTYGEQFYPFVIGAAINVQNALLKAKLESMVKVVVPCSFDAFLSESELPSKGHFRADINKTMIHLLTFLTKHSSPFFVTISPFLSLHQNKNISLNFALFKDTAKSRNNSHRAYKNSFDLSYDTLVTALSSVGFSRIGIVVAQIGWPTDGAANATSANAETFTRGLMEHLHSKLGTPLRPKDPPIDTYILSLLDEDQRSIAAGSFERHWGLFTFDGQAKYQFDFGQGSKNLVNAQNVEYLPPKWCVVNNNKDLSNASASALQACSSADCTALSPGGSCSNITWPGNISYAFNSYYQQHDQSAASCDFGGLGLITTMDPSVGKCRFPVELWTSHSHSFQRASVLRTTILLVAAILVT